MLTLKQCPTKEGDNKSGTQKSQKNDQHSSFRKSTSMLKSEIGTWDIEKGRLLMYFNDKQVVGT